MASPAQLEARVPRDVLRRCVDRLIRRALVTEAGCLVLDAKCPQVRVRVAPREYVILSAQRAVWAVEHGPAPRKMQVWAGCGTSGCFAPEHLQVGRLGSRTEEATRLGQERSREACRAQRKLSDEDVMRLRWWSRLGVPVNECARRLGVPAGAAYHVLAGRTYAKNGRKLKRGTLQNPQCTRCGGFGHYRNRGCPEAAISRVA